LEKILLQIKNLKRKQQEISDARQTIVKNMRSRGRAISKEIHEITISVAARQVEKVTIALTYVITGAKWAPSYDVRVETEHQSEAPRNETESVSEDGPKSGGSCELIYYGVITNSTGEDWKNVKVSLSTAAPSLGGTPPKLDSIKVQSHHEFGSFVLQDNFDAESSSEELDSSTEERVSDKKEEKQSKPKSKRNQKKKNHGELREIQSLPEI